MTRTTYFISYIPYRQLNFTNVIHAWLNKNYSNIYIENNCWFVVGDITAAELRDEILPLINSDDSLIVLTVGPDLSIWNLNKKISDWLKFNWHPGLPVAK